MGRAKECGLVCLRTPETWALDVLGTSAGWEVELKRRIAAVPLDSFSNTAPGRIWEIYSPEKVNSGLEFVRCSLGQEGKTAYRLGTPSTSLPLRACTAL